MAGKHWCSEHGVAFFKRGNMLGYAHPIKDEEGEDTGEWCNEPEEKEESPKKQKASPETPERQTSIETQNAYTGIVQLMVSKLVSKDEKLGQSALNYAQSKLANWSSMGEPPKTSKGEPMITDMQVVQLVAMAKERGYDPREVVLIMMEQYDESASKDLTEKEAKKLIGLLGEGYHIKEEPIGPEDIPF